ncbi:UNVERIFIED_CONTAM: hypothetical protein K2H54_051810 [Gekko kuhli]
MRGVKIRFNKTEMVLQEEIEKEEEINENTVTGDLIIEQFWKLLMEEGQKSIAEAFGNYSGGNQSVHLTLEKEEEMLQREQKTEEDQNYDQEEVLYEIQPQENVLTSAWLGKLKVCSMGKMKLKHEDRIQISMPDKVSKLPA